MLSNKNVIIKFQIIIIIFSGVLHFSLYIYNIDVKTHQTYIFIKKLKNANF